MGRKLAIPVAFDVHSRRVEAVRRRLGGRASTAAGPVTAGDLVSVRREKALPLPGVVVFVEGEELHVMTDETTVRRTKRESVGPLLADASAVTSFARLAADARVFGGLHEGQKVHYHDESERLGEGTLVEKCRYGAILLTDHRTLVGVGFRKIWPAAKSDSAPS